MLVEVWTRHSQVNEELDKEADALTLLLKTCVLHNDSAYMTRIAESIKAYATHVEQKRTSDRDDCIDTVGALDNLHHIVGEMVIDRKGNDVLEKELLRLVNDVIDTRGDRLAHLGEHVPDKMWALILCTSSVWFLAFFMLRIQHDVIAVLITGGTLFTVTAVLLVIKDIDNHEGGTWFAHFDVFKMPVREAQKVLDSLAEQDGSSPSGAKPKPKISLARDKKRRR